MLENRHARSVSIGLALLLLTTGCGSAMRDADAQPTGGPSLRIDRYLVPYFVEERNDSGELAAAATMDWHVNVVYTAGLSDLDPGPGADITVHLFDFETGLPLQNQGADVCAGGCSFTVSATNRTLSIRFDDLITNHGGMPFDRLVKTGFAIIVVQGDAANVNLLSFVTQANLSPLNISPLGGAPVLLESEEA